MVRSAIFELALKKWVVVDVTERLLQLPCLPEPEQI